MRGTRLVFGAAPTPGPHWQPDTPLGLSWGLYAVIHRATAFRFLPVRTRLRLVQGALGPFGSWWLRPRVEGVVPVRLGEHITAAERHGGGVRLTARGTHGRAHAIETGHVLAATSYRVHLDALDFLASELRSELAHTGGFPALDAGPQPSPYQGCTSPASRPPVPSAR
ncbi:hypothetical protein [Streptomyces shenzhenensis]|uniref:hypothetical protein n=1 Tax=Streptomyces shenzhenensis TaxID=943815 RepID=UPI0036BB88BC